MKRFMWSTVVAVFGCSFFAGAALGQDKLLGVAQKGSLFEQLLLFEVNKQRRKKAPKVKPSLSSLPLPSPDAAMSEQEAHPADVPETDEAQAA